MDPATPVVANHRVGTQRQCRTGTNLIGPLECDRLPQSPPTFSLPAVVGFSDSCNKSRPWRNVPSSGPGYLITLLTLITLSTGSNILYPLSLKTLGHSIQGQPLCVPARKKKSLVGNKLLGGAVIFFFFNSG